MTRRLSFGSFNSIEMAAAQLRGTEQPEGGREGGKGGGGSGRERGPHPGPSAPESSVSGRWQERREKAVPGPEGPKLSPLMQQGALTSWVPTQAAPAPCGGRWQCEAGPLGPPHTPLSHFPLPLPNLQRARGSCLPLPHPIPQGLGSMATATQTRRRLSASFISDIINHWSPRQHS